METGNLGEKIEQETICLKRNWLEIQNHDPESITLTLQNKYQDFVTKKQRTTSCMQWIPRKFCFSSIHDQMTVGFDTLGLGGQRTKIESEICSGVGAQCRKINGKPYGYKWKGLGTINKTNCAIEMEDPGEEERGLIKLYGGKRIPDSTGTHKQNNVTYDWSKWEKCNCWLCGLPLYFADADAAKGIFGNTKMKPECEHKLPILFLIMYGAGPATKIFKKDDDAVYTSDRSIYSALHEDWASLNISDVEDRKVHREHTVPWVKDSDFMEWKRTVRGWSYAWSHRVCNKIKSAMCFLALKVNKIGSEDKLQYTILDDMLEKFADIITRKKPLKTLLNTADSLYTSDKANPLGKPFGIWTNKQGDWRTIHRRSFYNFDTTKPDYEVKYDGLQVWQHEKHPLHAELFPEGETLDKTQKKRIIKQWLNNKEKNEDNWKNMVMYNLRQSLVPLVVELNKGNKGNTIYSPDSQMAILKNILANKFRFQHYIRKIFGDEAKIGDGTTKTADWDKVKNSYREINQNVYSGVIDYEVLRDYFNNIFIQDEGFVEAEAGATEGGCWPNCLNPRRKNSEDGTSNEKMRLLDDPGEKWDTEIIDFKEGNELFPSDLDASSIKSDDSSDDKEAEHADDSEGEDGSDVNDNMDEYIDVNIVNMSNVMSTFIDDETNQGKLDWDALNGKDAWERVDLIRPDRGEERVEWVPLSHDEMRERRTVKIPQKPISVTVRNAEPVKDLESFINGINENKFFNGNMTLSYDSDSDDDDGHFNFAELFTESESESEDTKSFRVSCPLLGGRRKRTRRRRKKTKRKKTKRKKTKRKKTKRKKTKRKKTRRKRRRKKKKRTRRKK